MPYEPMNHGLDLREVEPTLGNWSHQIPDAYVIYRELVDYVATNSPSYQLPQGLIDSLRKLEIRVNQCCKQQVFGRRVKMPELAKNIGSMFLEANFDYRRRKGIQTNQAVLSLYEVQAITPDEEWAEDLMERVGLSGWSMSVIGELLTNGQYTLQLANGNTLNEQQYAAIADDAALHAALGLRLLYTIPVFELAGAGNGTVPPGGAIITAPGNTVSIAADTLFTYTFNGPDGFYSTRFRLNGADILGGASDALPGQLINGQVISFRGGSLAGNPPGELVIVAGHAGGEISSNPVALTA